MTIREAAERIGKHSDTIRRAIQAKKLESTKINGAWNITEEALAAYAEAQGIAYSALGGTQSYTHSYNEVVQLRMQNEGLKNQVEYLKGQIQEKDKQIENLQTQLGETSHRHDTVVMQMTRLLEYHQQPFWRKWRKRIALPAPGRDQDMDTAQDDEKET